MNKRVNRLWSIKPPGLIKPLALTALLASCADSGVYLNTENSRFTCEQGLPDSQRERCLERVMTAEEYERMREKVLTEEKEKKEATEG